MEALFPKPAPVTEASLESILPPGSHLGNQMKDAIRQNTLPYQEGSGTLTDAARQIDFALLQTVLRLKLDKGRILLLTSDYRTQGKDIYHLQRMRIYLPCLLYTSDAADERSSVGLGGRRIIKKTTTRKDKRKV